MKKFLMIGLTLLFSLAAANAVMADAPTIPDVLLSEAFLQDAPVVDNPDVPAEADSPYESIFLTFAALVAGVVVIIEAVKKGLPGMKGIATQVFSWGVGVLLCFFGWWMGLGFLAGLEWWVVLLYGIGASLAANGFADTGFIQWVIGLFIRKKTA